MKTFRFVLAGFVLALAVPVAVTGCKTAPSQRTVEVTTLKVLGASVDTTMQVAAKLYHDGKISEAQWYKIAQLHDTKFQPAYNLAVAAVQANLDSVASADLVALAKQLADYVSQVTKSSL